MSISAELPNDKMPYLGEDEVASAKSATIATSNSNTSDAEEVEVKVSAKWILRREKCVRVCVCTSICDGAGEWPR